MKTRTSFVSNSSTSSYIIFYKDKNKGDLLDDFLWHLEHIGSHYYDDAYVIEILSLESYKGLECLMPTESLLAEQLLEKGMSAAEIQFSYHDRVAHRFFRDLQDQGRIKTISLS